MSRASNSNDPDFWPRYRVVSARTREELETEIKLLVTQGWKCLGAPARATPVDTRAPAYWAQTLYRSRGLPRETVIDAEFLEPDASR